MAAAGAPKCGSNAPLAKVMMPSGVVSTSMSAAAKAKARYRSRAIASAAISGGKAISEGKACAGTEAGAAAAAGPGSFLDAARRISLPNIERPLSNTMPVVGPPG